MFAHALLWAALAQDGTAGTTTETDGASVNASSTEVQVTAPPSRPTQPSVCDDWKARGLPEGPASPGYGHADMTAGRRACPRTELGLGGTLGLIVDRPNFYGNIGAQGVLFGSYALGPRTEVFGTLAFIDYQQVIGALTQSSLSVGDLTLGVNRGLYASGSLTGALTVRLLLPTASNIPNSRTFGADVGHAVSLRATSWLEVHGFVGAGFTLGLSAAPLPGLNLIGLVGAQVSPVSWFALVVDLSGGLASRSSFAPTLALRFRIGELGIELGATRPLAGTDRHLVIGGARFSWRF